MKINLIIYLAHVECFLLLAFLFTFDEADHRIDDRVYGGARPDLLPPPLDHRPNIEAQHEGEIPCGSRFMLCHVCDPIMPEFGIAGFRGDVVQPLIAID